MRLLEDASYLDTLPKEVVMDVLLPYIDMESLRKFSFTSWKWHHKVKSYLSDFNRVVQTKVRLHDNVFHSTVKDASKLVKLELIWSTGSESDNNLLEKILVNNKNLQEIDITQTSNQGWISTKVVKTLALELPKLKSVSFSSSRIRLFLGPGSSPRKLWPHTCWGSRRVNRESLAVTYTQDQVAVFSNQIQRRGCGRVLNLTEEHQVIIDNTIDNTIERQQYNELICYWVLGAELPPAASLPLQVLRLRPGV